MVLLWGECMYGSQNHFKQTLEIENFKCKERIQNSSHLSQRSNNGFLKFVLVGLTCIFLSSLAFAGQKQPRLAGGNGNANGR
jgi:hypothetical protein